MTYDVIIAGAGPAGSVAASLLARAGKSVVIVDPLVSPDYKIGESLPAGSAELLQRLELPYPQTGGPHSAIKGVHSLWGQEHVQQDALTTPGQNGWRLNRVQFDQDLLSSAEQLGATVTRGLVTQVDSNADGFQIRLTTGQSLSTQSLIDASGRSAAIARKLGAKQLADEPLIACWATGFKSNQASASPTLIETVGPHCPDANAWWYGAILPDGAPLAALHCTPEFAKQLFLHPERWVKQLEKTQIIADKLSIEAFKHRRLYRSDARGLVLDKACGPGWYACGDAALSFNPLASQGIHNAIATSAMAADAILSGNSSTQTDYQNSIQQIRQRYEKRIQDLQQRLRDSNGVSVEPR